MSTINDKIFGEMTYDFAWERETKDMIYSKLSSYKVAAQAFPGQDITDEQRKAYEDYKAKKEQFWQKIPDALLFYYLDNYDQILENINIPERLDKNHINRTTIVNLVRFKTLYFQRDGRFGWLCDCAWDKEHGICIILSDDVPNVDIQDALL